MRELHSFGRKARQSLGFATLALAVLALAEAAGQEKARVAVGQVASRDGTILERQAGGTTWKVLHHKDPVYSGDLLVGLPGAAVDSKDGAVRLTFLSDLDNTSPFPVLESAVLLREPGKDFDFSFVLDRGRIDITNRKDKGAARVQVQFRDEMWEMTLDEPQTRLALEMYSRWPAGIPFTKEPRPGDEPTAEVVLLALKGQANCKHNGHRHLLHAPPGPALLYWNSVTDDDPTGVRRLEKLPDWAEPEQVLTEEGKKRAARVERLRLLLAGKPLAAAIAQVLSSDDRVSFPIFMGAIDHLDGLLLSMMHKDPKVRDSAVLALRHWIGRGPGQDQKLYQFLVKEKKIPPARAETFLQLLHSFGKRDLAHPETYESLIAHLLDEHIACRELAAWHLYRLVPAGKHIKYDAAAPVEERKAAHDQWKALIPDGKLPPKPKEGDDK